MWMPDEPTGENKDTMRRPGTGIKHMQEHEAKCSEAVVAQEKLHSVISAGNLSPDRPQQRVVGCLHRSDSSGQESGVPKVMF